MSSDKKTIFHSLFDNLVKIGKALPFFGKAIFGVLLELLKLFPNLIIMIVLAQLLPLLFPSWLILLGLGWVLAALLPLIGAYIDIKNNIMKDRFGPAVRAMAAKFSSKDEGVDET